MRSRFLAILPSFALLALPAHASVLLAVDLSQANEITITATSGASPLTVTGLTSVGVYLADFFGANTLHGLNLTSQAGGNLTTGDNASNADPRLWRQGNDPGLNVASYTASEFSSFTFDNPAFTGSATWTIPADHYIHAVTLGLRSGDLYFPADRATDLPSASQLGQWEVTAIPEPRAAAFVLALGAVGLVVARRRKRVG